MPDLNPRPAWSEQAPSWIEATPTWVETDASPLFAPDVFAPKSWEIDSSLELIADHWSAVMADSTYFRFVDPDDRVTLQAGLLDASGTPQIITALSNGIVDEREIAMTPTEVIVTLHGRDASWAILDSYFTKLYARTQAALTPALQAFSEIEPGQTELLDVPASQIGNFKASDVARDAVESVGMRLSWEVRDYELQTPLYHASGRVVDILRQLIAPWVLCEPFKADIVVQDKTIRVKHRGLPNQTLPPMFTMTAAAAKRSGVTIRRRPLRKIGTVTLRGRRVPPGLARASAAQIKAGSGVYVASDETRKSADESYDRGGNVVSRVERVETYRMPDGILLKSVKKTLTLKGVDPKDLATIQGSPGAQLDLTSQEITENEWEPSYYEGTQAINNPKQLRQFVSQSGIDRDNDPKALFRVLNQSATEYSYDGLGFMSGETTTKQKWSFDSNQMVNDTQIVKTLRDVGPLLVEEVVDTFKWDADKKFWVIKERSTSQSGGHRPGGPGRGYSRSGTDDHYTLVREFSDDPTAQNVDYANDDLTLDDLNFLMRQFEAMADLVEYEFQFSGVAMPWLRRGVTIQFADLPLSDGSMLTPVTATITEIKTSYLPTVYLVDCRAFGWGQA